MVLALGAMLGLLVLVAYGMRRYLLDQNPVGKRQAGLRVLGRVSLTAKASVALVEAAGKVFVVGITGTTLTALGELPASALMPPSAPAGPSTEALPTTLPTSFAATLDEQSASLGAPSGHAEMFLRVSETIQQKISRLKQL